MYSVKIKSSSSIELLISLTIISICLVISLQLLKNFSNTILNIDKNKNKIECQNFLFNTINDITPSSANENIQLKIIRKNSNINNNIRIDFYSKKNNELLWQKDWISN